MRASFALEPNRVLRLLIQLRFVAVALYCVALVWLQVIDEAGAVALWLLPAALLVANMFYRRCLAERATATPWHIDVHLAVDTLALFLVPVALASVALPVWHAVAVTVLCALGYTILLLRYLAEAGEHTAAMGFERHVIGMWLNFGLAALLLCVFLLALAGTLRRRERELAAQRERLLRDDAIVSVATLAAGAAHALNTPLNTIVLAAESLAEHPELPRDAREETATIGEQAALCAQQLRRLVESQQPADDRVRTLAEYAAAVTERWRARRPEIEARVAGLAALPPVVLRDDPALSQALLNLLDNAADASVAAGSTYVAVNWHCNHEPKPAESSFELAIDDDGRGADADALAAGAVSGDKPEGLGLGLTLARASIVRLGGRLTFGQAPGAGIRTRVRLPLAALTDEVADTMRRGPRGDDSGPAPT